MKDLNELLEYIPPSALTYQEWANVGMALKYEGYDVSVWDRWSQADHRYKNGECAKKWNTFRQQTNNPVTGGTIYEMAKQYGYVPSNEVRVFDWDDEIEYDAPKVIKDEAWIDQEEKIAEPDDNWDAAAQFREYLETLFKPSDTIGYCTDALLDDGKWKPASKGVYAFKMEQILKDLKGGIESAIGDYNHEAGVWIRFNPLDGKGVRNDNVVDYRYCLVESDSVSIEKQKAIIDALKLPVAAMVASGGKSIHAIVKVFAKDLKEYQERVDYLYKVCDREGLSVDTQNKNASRLSRLPGVWRGKNKQFLIATNVGLGSFEEWKDWIEGELDDLPDITDDSDEELVLSPELIHGVLRQGHKMLVAGPSKAGKSFLLMELALAIANGGEWLGHQCEQGEVVFINLEIDDLSCRYRFQEIRKALELKPNKNLKMLNLRGHAKSLDKLLPNLIHKFKGHNFKAIIIDPIYKIITGDENSASEMAAFCNLFDRLCTELGASVIYCHHHSKGSQGHKSSMDRSSGSGVFARDPDAVLDIMQIDPEDAEMTLPDDETAWRVSSNLREFPSGKDFEIIFRYPLHVVTEGLEKAGEKYGASADTSRDRGHRTQTKQKDNRMQRLEQFVENWDEIKGPNDLNHPSVQDAVDYFKGTRGFSKANIEKWLQDGEVNLYKKTGFLYPKSQ